MAKFSVPYLKMRDGRPRWEPGPKLRAQGFKGVDLKDEHGEWLSEAAAIARARELNDERNGATIAGKAARPKPGVPVVRALWLEFVKTPEYMTLSAKTRADYESKANVFLETMGDLPVTDLRRKPIKDFWRLLYQLRGHAMANGVIAVLRTFLSYVVEEEYLEANPAKELKLLKVQPRVVTFSPTETALLAKLGDEAGEFGVVDGLFLAVNTGQRRGDILDMAKAALAKGLIRNLKQNKTDAIVSFPQTATLKRRIAALHKRHAENGWETERLVIDERTGQPFHEDTFSKRFLALKRQAVAWLRKNQQQKAADTLDGKEFRDTRDTALTRLYLAGATVLQIAAISGHEPKTVHETLKHYIALTEGDGAEAIKKLDAYMRANGIKV